MYKKLISSILAILIVIVAPQKTLAQTEGDAITEKNGQEYELGGVKVTGAQFSDEAALISVAGLKVGQKIRIPGVDVPKAIKNLWKLKLFTDVKVLKERSAGNVIFLEIVVQERPRYVKHSFKTLKKSYHDDINGIINRYMVKGSIVTENAKSEVTNAIQKFFVEKGYLDVKINIEELPEPTATNGIRLVFDIDRANRVKVQDVTFEGNDNISKRKLQKKMDKTKRKLKIFSSSKLVQKDYEEDKKSILKFYNKLGFRDAEITQDSMWREKDGDLRISMKISEGKKYYFRNITWKGNSIYDVSMLDRVFGLKKGDIYNQELLETRLRYSQDSRDVSSLYMDNGYLFFNVEPTEVAIDKDSIDLEMRMFEGPQATIDKVIINGNDRTNEHVIRRELRTKPGQKFSRADIIRSQREIVNLGYFNPEKLGMNTPVNVQRGTVDVEYNVEEKPSDQLELSAGWGGVSRGVIGTLGVSFNNFSMRNIKHRDTWSPLPQGDGQKLSLRAQTNGKYYQSYNMSFTEPWLGGKKPTSFSMGAYYTLLDYGAFGGVSDKIIQRGLNLSIGSRLKRPDDNFISRTELDLKGFGLSNYTSGNLPVKNGNYYDFTIKQTIARSTVNDPLFPREGSNFSLSAAFSLPYSAFRSNNTFETPEQKFRYLEYHKWRFNAEWYTSLVGKLVLKSYTKFGYLGYYNDDIGRIPFNRFKYGGNGLNNQNFGNIGLDVISGRGYTDSNTDFPANAQGAAVFNKLGMELRYPISLNPQSTIFVLAFAEGGNTYASLREFKPFEFKRAAGLGARIFLPMFGMLGFDYGVGFDKGISSFKGKSLKEIGTFNIIIGFEPE